MEPGARGLTVAAGVVALLAGAGPASAAPQAHATQVGSAPSSQRISLVFPLVADQAGLERYSASVSTPGSPEYGQYAPIAALSRRFGASPTTRKLVLAYLRRIGAGAVGIDATGLFADANVSAGLAQRLFATPLAEFRTVRGARFVAPTTATTVPAGLRGLVTGVVGLDTQPLGVTRKLVRARDSRGATAHAAAQTSSAMPRTGTVSPSACSAGTSAGEIGGDPTTAGFTPNQYLTAYGFDPLHNTGVLGQGERVALIEIDGFDYSDIKTFAHCFGLDIPAVHAFGVDVPGLLPPGGESTLDLEVLDAAAPDLKDIDIYETNPNAADTLLALTAPLQKRGFKPQVISVSLGLCEPALEAAVGHPGVKATEAALSMASASGITILASSGDQGSADCNTSSGHPAPRLAVNYPASSRWVTGVGGTNISLNAANQITGQLVWNDTTVQSGSATGGGGSELFPRPSYQQGTVGANHRAVPDVSLLADIIPGYAIYCTASPDCVPLAPPWEAVGGTSAATPLLAGGLALVDQDLRLRGHQDLGLVNPLLYEIGRSPTRFPQVLSDVLRIGNDIGPDPPSIGHALGCCSARRGFDEASGWGSVNLSSFDSVALRMQPPRESFSLPSHQDPVGSHKLMVTVSCALPCRMRAEASVSIGPAKPFTVQSRAFTLRSAGTKTVAASFSPRQVRKLRSGISHRRRIVAKVSAVILDSQKHVIARTATASVTIR